MIRILTLAVLAAIALGAAGCASRPPSQEVAVPTKPMTEAEIDAVIEQAELAIVTGRYDDAYVFAGRVLKTDPDHARANLVLSELALANGNFKEAVTGFDKLMGTAEVKARALQGKGIALVRNGQLEDGRQALEQAVVLDKSLPRAWNALAVYYDSKGQWTESEASYQHALELEPNSALLRNNWGYSLLAQQRYPEAETAFLEALKLQPEFAVARTNLRMARAWQGKYREASEDAEGPEQAPIVLNNIGYVALLRGDLAAAEAYFVRAMEASPSFNETAWKNLKQVESLKKPGTIGSIGKGAGQAAKPSTAP